MVKAKHPELIAGSMADERAAFDAMKAAEPPVVEDGGAIGCQAIIDGLRGTISWIRAKDRNATNWLYLEQAISTLLAMSSKADDAPECDHDWHYNGTDRGGSHKGEDAYKCHKCGKYEYRV